MPIENPNRVYYSEYRLCPRRGGVARSGILLKIDFADHGHGYSCLSSWPELGDLELVSLVGLIRSGLWNADPLLRQSLQMARVDAAARANRLSLFNSLQVPPSHGLSFVGDTKQDLDSFEFIKLKCPNDVRKVQSYLDIFCAEFPGVRIKLDFNAQLSVQEYEDFVRTTRPLVLERIAYIEDPTEYDAKAWPSLGGPPLARDLSSESEMELLQRRVAPILIIKPARQNFIDLRSEILKMDLPEISVTSYLDHPLGQCHAAWTAAQLASWWPNVIHTCGLQSHLVYEPTAYSEQLGSVAQWQSPGGFGFGFDSLLEQEAWERLV